MIVSIFDVILNPHILSHDWPGNVRELENVIARATVIAPGGVITPEVFS